MARTRVERDNLLQASSAITNCEAELNSIQARLSTQLAPLLDGTSWRGNAGGVFQQLYPAYQQQIQDLYASLNELGVLVQGSARSYEQEEDDAARIVNANTAELGAGGKVGNALTTTRMV
ncbi:WXG100 family type VII secretion target [Micromonospora sp. NPDC003197]